MNNPAQLTAYDTSGKARPAQSSMTTETTPEQLAKWREEARKIVHNEPSFTESENVCDWYVGGYLRAKQEDFAANQPMQPITAEDVTDSMLAAYFKDRDMFIAKTLWPYKRRDIAAAVNAYRGV